MSSEASRPTQVAMTQLEVPDYELGLRGKLLRPQKLTGSSLATFCTIVYGLSLVDEVTDTPFSNAKNGYPDAAVKPDESTRVTLPWRGSTDAVIVDMVDADGELFAASPRSVLKQLLKRYDAMGLSPVLGFEYEFWIFYEDEAGDPRSMRPLGRTENAYSLSRSAEISTLAQEFIDRMEHIGAPVEAFHSELGPGFFEFAMAPRPALQAADGAARARQYMRELCAERGFKASFMAKPFADRSGAGGHVHSSIESNGKNVFASGAGQLSDLGQSFVAGLIDTMGEFAALFSPYVNSYKRIDPEMFVADRASWGLDDRTSACRLLLESTSGARVENRVPGADANPFLVAVGLLAGGLIGIEKEMTLPADSRIEAAAKLPLNLASAVDLFLKSARTRETLGDTLVDAFGATRRAEVQRYESWLRNHISDWELSRHLEHQ